MTRTIKQHTWPYKGLVVTDHGTHVSISVVFTWLLEKAYDIEKKIIKQGRHVILGGPAYALTHDITYSTQLNFLQYHNSNACFTSRGCINKCAFCAVPKIEGDYIELNNIEFKPIICDNNLLAASKKHFSYVMHGLRNLKKIDFNQGLDARLLTIHHLDMLRSLNLKCLRFAWDNIKDENKIMDVLKMCIDNGIPKSKISVYVLIGFRDTPEDAYYRLNTLRNKGIFPFPMRYQPLYAKKRNEYTAPGWTDTQLKKYVRYFANLRITNKIPFEDFIYNPYKKTP